MKKLAVIGGGVAVLVVGAAALPYYVGMKAEQGLRADHELIAQELVLPGLSISLADYQRGWLSAEATTLVTFTPEQKGAEPLQLEIHHAISHLPSLGHAAIASVTSEVVVPAKWKEDVDRVLNGQSPLTVVSYIGFTGKEKSIISSPAFKTALENDTVNVEWQGVQGTATESSDNSHMTANLAMPGLKVTGAQGNISVDAISYDVDMVRGSYDMWFGKSSAAVKSVNFDTNDGKEKHQIAINNLSLATEQKERDAVTDGSGVLELGKSNFDDVSLDSAVYDFEFRNLDTKTLHDLQEAIRHSYSGGDPAQMEGVMMNAIPALLKAKPEINIRRLEMNSSLGTFNGKLHLAFVGEWNDAMMGNPLAIVAMLNADMDLAISKGLLVSIVHSQMRSTLAAMAQMQGAEISDEELDSIASERAKQQLDMLQANGYLDLKDDNYATKIHFEKGQLTINGKAANEFFGKS